LGGVGAGVADAMVKSRAHSTKLVVPKQTSLGLEHVTLGVTVGIELGGGQTEDGTQAVWPPSPTQTVVLDHDRGQDELDSGGRLSEVQISDVTQAVCPPFPTQTSVVVLICPPVQLREAGGVNVGKPVRLPPPPPLVLLGLSGSTKSGGWPVRCGIQ
jgi:hypothetical protein